MFSDNERDYLDDPDAFAEKYSDSYVRKIRHQIRYKCMETGEDLIRLAIFSKEKDDGDCWIGDETKDTVGRWKKQIVPLGFFLIISAIDYYWSKRMTETEKKESIDYMKKTAAVMLHDTIKDTKIGKLLYDKAK